MPTSERPRAERLRPYVPGFVIDWLRDTPALRHREVPGTLAFVDISGFTRLTERLAGRGKVGAEEMTELLDRTFAELLGVAYAYGAWLVKWGGDAVLLLFQGDGHAERAGTAAIEMRRTMDVVGRLQTSSGPVRLRISTGVHSGAFDFFLVGSSHHELVITGPGATATAELEAAASAGQVAVSAATAALLRPGLVRAAPDGVLLLARSPGARAASPLRPSDAAGVDLATCLPAATRDHLLTGDDEAEHRLAAVGFVEFSGVDALLADAGPGAVTAAVEAVVRTCQESAERHGVTFWETDISRDGGKVMLVAGVPVATGAEEDALLAVARDVVEAPSRLAVRVGVNTGRVFFGQFGPPYRRTMSVKGDAVNLAARLMAKAGPGEVLAAAAVVDGARTPYAAEPLPPFQVKGRLQPVFAARIGPPRAGAGPTVDSEAPVLVGRERELRRLHAEWRIAQHGALRLCRVVGEAGAGKTRLIAELATSIDATVVEARADRYTATSAYAPFRRLLRQLLQIDEDDDAGAVLLSCLQHHAPELLPWSPLIAAVVGATVPRTAESDAVDDRFRGQLQAAAVVDLLVRLLPAPTLLVLDDAHLLDASSAALLTTLAVRAAAAPWLVVVGRREDTRAADDDAARRTVLRLGPLAPDHALRLLHRLTESSPLAPHVAAGVVRRAGGNPLYLVELAAATRHGARLEDLPDSVEHVVASRVDRLQPAERRLLRAAAVIGLDVDRAVLAALAARLDLPLDRRALTRLAPFLSPVTSELLRFRQALVQETAYEGLPYSRRKLLHGFVADALVEQAGDAVEEHAGVLSLHLLRAERYDEAWRFARLAADQARVLMAHGEAAALYDRALTAGRGLAERPAELTEVAESLGDVRTRLGAFAAAGTAYAIARRSCPRSGVAAARLHYKTAIALDRMGSYPQALRWLSSGLRVLDDTSYDESSGRLAAEIAVERATVRHWQGRHREATRECNRAIALAEGVGATDVLADALVWLDVNELMLGTGDGVAARRALEIWTALGDRPWHEGRCFNELGIRAYYAGQWDEAQRLYLLCQDANARAGDAWAASVAQGNAAEILSDQGRLAEAEPLLRDALRVWRASAAPSFIAFGRSTLGRLAARDGRYDEALDLLSAARAQYLADGEHAELLETDARLAECRLLSGDAATALDTAREATARAERLPGLPPVVPLLHRVIGQALAALGELEDARTALGRSLDAARARQAEHEIAFTLHALARLPGAPVSDELRQEQQVLFSRLGIVAVAQPPTVRRPTIPTQSRREDPAPVTAPSG